MPLILSITLNFLTANKSFEKILLGLFPYGAYVSLKNDSPNLTRKV